MAALIFVAENDAARGALFPQEDGSVPDEAPVRIEGDVVIDGPAAAARIVLHTGATLVPHIDGPRALDEALRVDERHLLE